ncbi:aspartic peptidase domain-containing protein [Trametes polyzona]|nr:aspartic peptidase domain-containing protein [Trametes polyzona]
MSSQLAIQFTLFVFTLSTQASPTASRATLPTVLTDGSERRAPQAHDSGTLSTNNVTAIRFFNAERATRELKSVMTKYANAGKFLSGIGLNPDTHPEKGYPEFHAPNKSTFSQTTSSAGMVSLTSSNTTADGSNQGIIHVTPVARQPGTLQMPLTDWISDSMDILYYGAMNFGQKQTVLQIDVDTGSADLWVPVNCKRCTNASYLPDRKGNYQSTGKKCTVTYGTGRVSGIVSQDTVGIGNTAVANQTFCAVTKVSNDLDDEPVSGLLGLAFGSIAQASNDSTFFENLLESKALAASVFSVCFGCYDPTKAMGPITWNNLESRTYWSITMNGLSVNDTQHQTKLTAAIDTGTSLIYVPAEVADAFYDLIPGSSATVQYGGGFYSFPCDTKLTVSLMFGGQSYAIHPADFNIGKIDDDSGDCIGGIISLGDGFPNNLVIVGDEFLKSWYSVYDYSGRVGFAPSINNR